MKKSELRQIIKEEIGHLNEIKFKDIPVDKTNYKKYKYRQDDDLSKLSDEELKARAYYIKDIFRGMKGPTRLLGVMDMRNIYFEFQHRGINMPMK